MAANIEEITRQATAMVRAKTGDPGSRITDITPLPGHAGFGYSFILERASAGGPSGKLVLRVAPEGVRIAGPADVVRQAKIMQSLADTEVPVPQILWYGDEPEFFGRPYFVDVFVDGFKLADTPKPREEARAYARAAIEKLAALHRLPWEPRRDAWGGGVTALGDEMARLDHLLDRDTLDPQVVARAPELREKLRSSIPRQPRIGIVHGDFQWSNIMFNHGRVVALIDWEISMLGPTLLDLGWLCFFSDPQSFFKDGGAGAAPMNPGEIVETYSQKAGFPVPLTEVSWFRAFAGYRFGVITVFNLMLHRRGKRNDPHWEEIAKSAPRMFEQGLELLT